MNFKRVGRPLILAVGLCLVGLLVWQSPIANDLRGTFSFRKTVADQIAIYGGDARKRMSAHFAAAGVAYPPDKVTLLFLKSDKTLSVYATDPSGKQRLVKSYPVLAASGKPGPKLREGDRQVPEGIYRVEALNPNSAFHLALRLNYPNEDDRRFAKLDNRSELGSDIMIHGNRVSVGCLAIGDEAIEEVFTLAADTTYQNWKVVLAPSMRPDLSEVKSDTPASWRSELYSKLSLEIEKLQEK